MRQSRISHPASSIAAVSRCDVRVPPNATKKAPGLATLSAAVQNAWLGAANDDIVGADATLDAFAPR